MIISLYLPSFNAISNKQLHLFTHSLYMLLQSNLPLLDSLYILNKKTSNKKINKLIKAIIKDLKQGLTLYQALKNNNIDNTFDNLYLSLIELGLASNSLKSNLKLIVEYLEEKERFKNNTLRNIYYPSIILLISLLILIFFLLVILPSIEQLLLELSLDIPDATNRLISFSHLVNENILLILTSIFTFIYFFIFSVKTSKYLNKLITRLPVIGRLYTNQIMLKIYFILATGISAKLDISKILNFCINNEDNILLKEMLTRAKNEIISGYSLSDAFSNTKLFDEEFILSLSIGQNTGRLGELLQKTFQQKKLENQSYLKTITKLIEPMFIVVVTVVIGAIMTIMYLPLINLYTAI